MKRSILSFFMLLMSIQLVFAQCPKPDRLCPGAEERRWSYNSQSKSAAFEKGKKYTMSFIAYRGQAYNISVCTQLLEEKNIKFNVYTKVTEQNDETGRYERVKKPLFNNNEDKKQSCVVAGERTSKIFVELSVPVGESEDEENQIKDLVCVGVLIEQTKNVSSGF